MSDEMKKILSGLGTKPLQNIDEEDNITVGSSVCAECRHCLIVEKDIFHCTAGDVKRIPQDPITGLEARVFKPNETGFVPSTYGLEELPFPGCYIFNEDGECPMYEFGKPNKIKIVDSCPDDLSPELYAYMRTLQKQNN